ncbi:fatty acid desaturase family protein [Arthrobacter roseus]|uniref:fatty acid desaturase family protein n=1 Tax=Arthrobacter roseus TaxID=136274 RepID=UPI001962ACAC|nr:acyl-CoA desaturase [Arthrobacter roseus]MBM7846966.1 fatty acid desaturase [Arthrobacter roseus]
MSTTTSGRAVRVSKPNDIVASYSVLLKQVRSEGLLTRRRGFYISLFILLTLALGAAWTGFALLGDTWFQLLIAGVLGIIFTQIAFLAHEASHRQIFKSRGANDWSGRVLAAGVVGISYAWWMDKHTRHHNDPNVVGKDPDIELDTISFIEEDAAKAKGVLAWITRRQGYLFFPLLTLEGFNLHGRSMQTLFQRSPVKGRWVELALIGLRFGAYFGVLFWFLPVGMAFAFIGVQMAVFGVYMGASFAPNHKGMPIIPRGSKLDFFQKQVLTARNIRGGSFINNFFGGLNYQVEHHLFPDMPRPHLRKASAIVREHCARLKVPYTEVGVAASYASVVSYLNRVGLAARDPFDCPMVNRYRRQ